MTRLMNALSRLDAIHRKLLDLVTPLNQQSFAQCPGENEWSVAEILHHLRLVEERVIKQLMDAIEKEPRRVSFVRRHVPVSIVASRVVKVQAPKGVVPTNPPEKEESIAVYNEARTKLKNLVAEQGFERLDNVVFNHPFLGEISGTAAISFVAYHERRHYKQICDVLRRIPTFDI